MERPRRPLNDLTTFNIRFNQTSGDKETFTANKTKTPKLLKQKSPLRGIAEDVNDPLLIELGPGMVTRSMVKRVATITKSNNPHMLLIPGNSKLKGSGGIQPSSCLYGTELKVTNAVNFTASAAQGKSEEKSQSTQSPSLVLSCHGRELRSRAKKQSRDVAQKFTGNKNKSKARQVVGDETFIISSNVEVVHTEKPATSPQTDVPQRQENVAIVEGENGEEIHNVLYFSASSAQGKSEEKSQSTQSPSLVLSCHGRELRSPAKKQSRDVAQKFTGNKNKSKARQVVGDETFIISSNVEVVHTEKPATSPQTDVPQRQENVAMADGESGDENHDVHYFRCILKKEVDRLERVCAKWSSVQQSTCLPQEVSSLIDTALGQTGLLINQKFSQFRKLIDKCELKRGRLPIFLSDLEGFWDIICLQVKNIDNRFFHLEKLEVNNWQESSPEVKSFIKKKKVPIPIKPEHKVKTSVQDFIEATRRKQQLQSNKENAGELYKPLHETVESRFYAIKCLSRQPSRYIKGVAPAE